MLLFKTHAVIPIARERFYFSVRHIHRICSGKAGRAERKAARHFIQIPDRHIPQGIGSNFLPDSVYGVAVCDECLLEGTSVPK